MLAYVHLCNFSSIIRAPTKNGNVRVIILNESHEKRFLCVSKIFLVLYGMRFGYQFAVPLGAVTAFVGTTFLACNRHYFSQLIAGAGFGAIYALAANKVI